MSWQILLLKRMSKEVFKLMKCAFMPDLFPLSCQIIKRTDAPGTGSGYRLTRQIITFFVCVNISGFLRFLLHLDYSENNFDAKQGVFT